MSIMLASIHRECGAYQKTRRYLAGFAVDEAGANGTVCFDEAAGMNHRTSLCLIGMPDGVSFETSSILIERQLIALQLPLVGNP